MLPEIVAVMVWAKVEAAKNFMSLSRMVAETLSQKMSKGDEEKTQLKAAQEMFAVKRPKYQNVKLPKRDELYEE